MTFTLPINWRMVKLGDCLQRRKITVMPASLSDESVGLVGLEDIQDGGRGGIAIKPTSPREIESLKTWFYAGDILYGKLRPYLNKVGIAPQGGLCSTEIWAFEAKPAVNSKYVAFFLASSFFVDRVSSLTKGANLPRLDTDDFDSIEIPLPPPSEQRRIVEILHEAEEIRCLRAEAETKTAELIPAMFYEVLDKDEASKKRPLGHWFESKPNYGTMTPADAVPGNDGVVCLRVCNIQNNRIDLSDRKYVQRNAIHSERHTVRTGDIVLARAIASEEHLGKAVVITPNEDGFAFDSHLMRIRLRQDELVPEFLQVYLYSAQGRNAFLKQTRQSAVQFNVNTDEMARVLVPDVEPEEQQIVVQSIKEAESICKVLEASTTQGSLLSTSLSAHAFSGQLTADWREAHADTLAREALERDAALKQAGAVISPVSPPVSAENEADFSPSTEPLLADLNREQLALWRGIVDLEKARSNEAKQMKSSLRYFTAESISKSLKSSLRRNPQAIEGHLAVFVARGLVIPVSREEQTEDTGEFVFGNAYRLPLEAKPDKEGNEDDPVLGDPARNRELERLAARLEKERAL